MDDDIRARARARRQARTGFSLSQHRPQVSLSLPLAKVTNGSRQQEAKTPSDSLRHTTHRPLPVSSILTTEPQITKTSNRPPSLAASRRGELLSPRQRIVIEAFINGLSNKDIKEILPKLEAEVTKETISNYFTNVINKIINEKNFEGDTINRCRAILHLLEHRFLKLEDYLDGIDDSLQYELSKLERKMLLMFASGMHDINIARQLEMTKPKFDELKHDLQTRFKAKTIERVFIISLVKGLIPNNYSDIISALDAIRIKPSNRAIKLKPEINAAANAGILAEMYVDKNFHKLSRVELNILVLLSVGFKVKNIAKDMDITESVIYTHRDNIMGKLQVKTFNQAMRRVLKEGLIELSFDPKYISPVFETLSLDPDELQLLSEIATLEDKAAERTFIAENQTSLKSLGVKFNLKEKFDCLRASDILYMFKVECLRIGLVTDAEEAYISLSK